MVKFCSSDMCLLKQTRLEKLKKQEVKTRDFPFVKKLRETLPVLGLTEANRLIINFRYHLKCIIGTGMACYDQQLEGAFFSRKCTR